MSAMVLIMELEMEGVVLDELHQSGRSPVTVWLGYWILQAVMEAVLAFGVFAVMAAIILGLQLDAWHFVRPDQVIGWELVGRLAVYEVLALAVPWLVYGCFQAERRLRWLFLLRWGLPMSLVIWVSMVLVGPVSL